MNKTLNSVASYHTMKELLDAIPSSKIDTVLYNGNEQVGFEVWTKEMAREQLEHNKDNRKIIGKAVEEYKSMMENAGFGLSGDSIIIDNTGNLLNGQNRLKALLESENSWQVFVVLRNVCPEIKKHENTGRAQTNYNRTQMFLKPLFEDVKEDMWGIICRILAFENPGTNQSDYTTKVDVVTNFCIENWGLLGEINKRHSRSTNFRNVPLVKALEFELRKSHGNKARDFFDKCYEGGQKRGTAPWALIEWNRLLMNHTANHGEQEAEIATLRAFEGFLEGHSFSSKGNKVLTAYEQDNEGKPIFENGHGLLNVRYLFKHWNKN